jgi:Ca2+-binding RTX toxin-like protein
MRARIACGLLVAVLCALIAASTATSAGNGVSASRVSRIVQAITANSLKPAACASLSLTTVVAGVNGTAGNDLLLGSANADVMNGNAGNDCILGGGGNDTIDGGAGTDVCIGGPGTDTFTNCETQIQ